MTFCILTETPKNIQNVVDKQGAIILRQTEIDTVDKFSDFVHILGEPNVDMSCSAGPRLDVASNVFTSNEAPSNEQIPPHHEMAQCEDPPSYIVFYCLVPPLSGGCTPIIRSIDVAKQFKTWYPSLYERLKKEGVRYLRELPSVTEYTQPLGKSWKETYHVKNHTELETKLNEKNISWKWLDNDVIQTIGPILPIFRKDNNGEESFFMAAETSFVNTNLVSKKMLLHGNGDYFDNQTAAAFHHIGKYAFTQSTRIPWCEHDILIINNSTVMHSRDSFTGPRKIVVSLIK